MVGLLIAVGFVFFIIMVVRRSSGSARLVAGTGSGQVRARGLVLQAFQASSGTTVGSMRYERRQMTIDVEIPGMAPYVVSGFFLLPRGLVEGIPGSSLDLAVDPRNPNQIAVLGPGGFSGPWLQQQPPRAY